MVHFSLKLETWNQMNGIKKLSKKISNSLSQIKLLRILAMLLRFSSTFSSKTREITSQKTYKNVALRWYWNWEGKEKNLIEQTDESKNSLSLPFLINLVLTNSEKENCI